MTAVTDSEIARTNRLVTIDFLRKLSDTAGTALQETCVRAWAQVARLVGRHVRFGGISG